MLARRRDGRRCDDHSAFVCGSGGVGTIYPHKRISTLRFGSIQRSGPAFRGLLLLLGGPTAVALVGAILFLFLSHFVLIFLVLFLFSCLAIGPRFLAFQGIKLKLWGGGAMLLCHGAVQFFGFYGYHRKEYFWQRNFCSRFVSNILLVTSLLVESVVDFDLHWNHRIVRHRSCQSGATSTDKHKSK